MVLGLIRFCTTVIYVSIGFVGYFMGFLVECQCKIVMQRLGLLFRLMSVPAVWRDWLDSKGQLFEL